MSHQIEKIGFRFRKARQAFFCCLSMDSTNANTIKPFVRVLNRSEQVFSRHLLPDLFVKLSNNFTVSGVPRNDTNNRGVEREAVAIGLERVLVVASSMARVSRHQNAGEFSALLRVRNTPRTSPTLPKTQTIAVPTKPELICTATHSAPPIAEAPALKHRNRLALGDRFAWRPINWLSVG